jgi:cytochrome c peroxidase
MRQRLAIGALGVAVALASACDVGTYLCTGDGCGWSEQEKSALIELSRYPGPPTDSSNKYDSNPDAIQLGKLLYHDTRFSGPSTQVDALGRAMPFGRVNKGDNTGVACVSCHDAAHGNIDPMTTPGNVSVGAGWTFANALSTCNASYYALHLWNGRADSLWSQAVADNENGLTTNGNRLHTAWVIQDHYRDRYNAVFPEYSLPLEGSSSAWQSRVDASGQQCTVTAGACPSDCRVVTGTNGNTGCFPRFPLAGKPGKVAGCQPGDAGEPFGDAFDCMADEDQKAVTRVLVNFAKAIAAYENQLVTKDAPFDQWIADLKAGKGDVSTAITDQAKHGARLFVGKAACNECHTGWLFSDNKFHNVGVDQVGAGIPKIDDCPAGGVCDCAAASDTHAGPKNCIPWGAYDGIDKLQQNKFRRDSMWSDDTTATTAGDFVTMKLTDKDGQALKGAYRTPSLRNVAQTAPYFHNGSFANLKDVIAHYNTAGSSSAPGFRSAAIKPLYLTQDEQEALEAFLRTLNDAPLPADLVAPPVLPP